jgi:hypothetical protein
MDLCFSSLIILVIFKEGFVKILFLMSFEIHGFEAFKSLLNFSKSKSKSVYF